MAIRHGAKPEPTSCDVCKSTAIICTFDEGRKIPCNVWSCKTCGAAVGCYNGTRIPFGNMADFDTRRLRVKAHEYFDKIWDARKGVFHRREAYSWLAHKLGIEPMFCHMSRLTKQQLVMAINESRHFLESELFAQLRRNKKKNGKAYARPKPHGIRVSKSRARQRAYVAYVRARKGEDATDDQGEDE